MDPSQLPLPRPPRAVQVNMECKCEDEDKFRHSRLTIKTLEKYLLAAELLLVR
jgi:hypothetical protein